MTLPRVQPITPTWRKEPFDDPDWLFDFKYDGFRALYYIEPGHNRLISRNGNLLTRFDVLAGALAAELNVDDAIIDGEVIAADETGRPQFYDLLRGTRAPAYVAFDIVWLNGADLRSLPLHERRRALQTILPNRSPIVSEALSVTHRGSELFELMCANDLEGIVAKRLVDPYDTRIRWLKIKNRAYTQTEGAGATCSMGRAIQPNAGPVGDAPRRSADDARQRRHGACAIVWCKECRHQVEPDPAAMADRYGAATTVPE